MGWAKGFPTLDGDYYSRIDEFDKQPAAIRIESRTSNAPAAVYEFGCDKDLRREYEAENYEYLGPISSSDFEQLTRLRDAAHNAIQLINLGQYRTAIARLKGALAQRETGEKS